MIHCLTNLQYLDLSCNALASVRLKFSLAKLTVLVLRGNQIRALAPYGFAGLRALTTLDLSDNMIQGKHLGNLQGTVFFADGSMGAYSLT
jgi:Leucine-rich repeat (LRR) protein